MSFQLFFTISILSLESLLNSYTGWASFTCSFFFTLLFLTFSDLGAAVSRLTLICPLFMASSNLFNLESIISGEVSYSILHILIAANSRYILLCLDHLDCSSASCNILIFLINSSILILHDCCLILSIFSVDISKIPSGFWLTFTIRRFLRCSIISLIKLCTSLPLSTMSSIILIESSTFLSIILSVSFIKLSFVTKPSILIKES